MAQEFSQEDTTYEEQVGLQGQPVQCKLIEKYGQTRFGSHEATEEQVRDENGKLTKNTNLEQLVQAIIQRFILKI